MRTRRRRLRAEEALRESEQQLRLLIEHTPAAVAMLDREMRYLAVSRRFSSDLRAPAQDLVGRNHYDVFPDIPARWRDIHRRCLAGAVEKCDEDPFPRADGSLDWVRWEIRPWRRADGEIGGIVLFSEVITERKRSVEALRESEERFRLLVQGTRDCAIYMLDADGTVRSWNAGAEQMFGYREDEIVGRHREVFFTEEDREAGKTGCGLAEAAEHGHCEEESWRVRKDGSRFWANVLLTALRDDDDGLRGFGNITRDFTERKRAEEERKRAEELRASEAALRESDRQRTEFLAVLSHELRNPLAPIRNGLYVLEHASPGGEQARRARAIIERQIGLLTSLIDELLDVTRITRGKIRLQREPLDLADLARRTVEDHRTLFVKSGIRVEMLPAREEVWVEGDRVRLAQALGNLLQNAAKFTPAGGETSVFVQSDAAGGQAILTVRDTGVGIEPEVMPRLFQPFAQADSTLDRSKGGLGLGLALIRALVEMHGGSVSAASAGPGKGSAFTITLPLDVTADRTTPGQRGIDRVAGPRRVLVIEDNHDAADSLRDVLELDEHSVEVAHGGREGIDKARAFRPDVVLCDIGLPEMDGYQVARAMRADPQLGRVALVAVSGYAQPEDVAMAKEAGFDAHLAKPPSIEALERTIAEVQGTRAEGDGASNRP